MRIIHIRDSLNFFPKGLWAAIFLAERDCKVPSARVVQVIRQGKNDNVNIYVMPELDHGGFVLHNHWSEKVVHCLLEIDIDSEEKK